MTTPEERRTRAMADRGWLNEDGIGRTIRRKVCTRCGSKVLGGLDADRLSLSAIVGPWLLTVSGEVAVVLRGGSSYRLRGTTDNPLLDWRAADDIKANPANTCAVLGTHFCDMGASYEYFQAVEIPYSAPRVVDADMRIPF